MESAPLVPANFRISEEAQIKLNELTAEASKAGGRAMVPALFWADEIKTEMVLSGIAWGWYYRDEIPARLIQAVDGIDLIVGLEPKQALRFECKGIEYDGDRRFFLGK